MTDVRTHDIGATGEVAVRVRSGDVRLRATAGTVVVVRAAPGDDLDRVAIDPRPGAVEVRCSSSEGLDLEVPAGATVRLEAGSADLDVQDLHGVQHYRTASGDVRCRGLGGDVTVDAVSGDVELMLARPAAVRARTVSGDLTVRAGVLRAFRGATTSGDLHVAAAFDGPGPFGMETVSGDAVLTPEGPLRIEATTITGDVRAEVAATAEGARTRRTLVIGRGGPTLTFRSTSGDLRITGDPQPDRPPVEPKVPALPALPPEPPMPTAAEPSRAEEPAPPIADRRLAILRELEAGRIDITEAEQRLGLVDAEEAIHG